MEKKKNVAILDIKLNAAAGVIKILFKEITEEVSIDGNKMPDKLWVEIYKAEGGELKFVSREMGAIIPATKESLIVPPTFFEEKEKEELMKNNVIPLN